MEHLLKTSAVIAIFYVCYKLFLQRETFFEHNRWFLLMGLITSFLIPFLVIPIYVETTPLDLSNFVFETATTENVEKPFSILDYLPIIYGIGVGIFTLRFFVQFASLAWVIFKNKGEKIGGFIYIETNGDVAPFSFFNWIVCNPTQFTETELNQIMTHEKVHATQKQSIDILLTHLHFDHIQGLGFFSPLFDRSMEVHIWGPASSRQSLHSRLSRYLSPPLFPVHIRDLPCKLKLHEIDKSEFDIGPFRIQSRYVIHPGPTVGFRISHANKTFTYIPDHEPALGLHGIVADKKWVSGIDLANEADILLHDAQYTKEQYQQRIGWGHSSMDDAVYFASLAGAKKILLAHHDPSHTDQMLEALVAAVTKQSGVVFELAAEGMEIDL